MMYSLILNSALLIITTIITFYLYKETHIDGFLIGGTGTLGNALYTLYALILGIPNMWIVWDTSPHLIFNIMFIVFALLCYVGIITLLHETYKDKEWGILTITLLIWVISMISMFILDHNLVIYTGNMALIIGIMGFTWYKTTPRCFNPFKC